MNLEDHPGDIIHKARIMSNVTTAAAAMAAGISEGELAALEEHLLACSACAERAQATADYSTRCAGPPSRGGHDL